MYQNLLIGKFNRIMIKVNPAITNYYNPVGFPPQNNCKRQNHPPPIIKDGRVYIITIFCETKAEILDKIEREHGIITRELYNDYIDNFSKKDLKHNSELCIHDNVLEFDDFMDKMEENVRQDNFETTKKETPKKEPKKETSKKEPKKETSKKEPKKETSKKEPKKETSKKELKEEVKKKKIIPKALRMKVWEKNIGNILNGVCYSCEREIKIDSFEAGHIISEKNGGEIHIDNLKPICKPCNTSCATMNLDEFKKIMISIK
jgi:hypothetical protein